MLGENPYDTFFSKMGYIFIEFGSEWLKRHDSKRRSSYVFSLIRPSNYLIRAISKPFSVVFLSEV